MDKNRETQQSSRGRGQSGGNRRAARDARRAYEHYNSRQQLADWGYEPEAYDPGREVNRRPTQRSQNWKNRSNGANASKKSDVVQEVRPSTVEDAPRDEPLYDIGPHSSLVPEQDYFAQNFDFSGFVPLLNQTYEKLRGIDPRLHDRLPQSMFVHAMTTHLNLDILEVARSAGQNVLNLRTDAREILPDYQVVPQPIADYLSHITSVITQDGREVRVNLPQAAIPQGPVIVDGAIVAASGSFGVLDAASHNAYECYISPLVTSNRVTASAEHQPDYQPLPPGLLGDLVPNRNLLGFDDIDIANAGANARLAGIQFPNDDTLEGRYRYSALLQTRVYTVLAEMKDRFKMVELRRQYNEKGLNIMDKIPKRVTQANLAYVEAVGPLNDDHMPLYTRHVNILSSGALGSAVSNQAGIEVMHRRRITQGPRRARGLCCLTEAGNAPGGWAATANDNFQMLGAYAPVVHQDYANLRGPGFSSYGPAGVRLNVLTNFIERNYYVKR